MTMALGVYLSKHSNVVVHYTVEDHSVIVGRVIFGALVSTYTRARARKIDFERAGWVLYMCLQQFATTASIHGTDKRNVLESNSLLHWGKQYEALNTNRQVN